MAGVSLMCGWLGDWGWRTGNMKLDLALEHLVENAINSCKPAEQLKMAQVRERERGGGGGEGKRERKGAWRLAVW
eukprot:COSAG05_NODE_3504_length_2024_cov_1.375065_6_plen_74_part_01